MRSLNGRVEELTFQVLELQELLRQTREDNESRFLDLEEGADSSDSFGTQGSLQNPDAPKLEAETNVAAAPTDTNRDANAALIDPASGSAIAGVDAGLKGLGNPLNLSDVAKQLGNGTGANIQTNTDVNVGNLPAPADLYQRGYSAVLSGDYKSAQKHFSNLVKAYPDSEQVADANYWLGESLFAQGDFNDAAEAYMRVVNQHPDANLAPDAMLKLGIALIGMGQTSVACETFAEVGLRYPKVPSFFMQRLNREMRSASCS